MSDGRGKSRGLGGIGGVPPEHQRPPGSRPGSGRFWGVRPPSGLPRAAAPPGGLIKPGGTATLPLGVVGVGRGAPACFGLHFVQGTGTKFKGLRFWFNFRL